MMLLVLLVCSVGPPATPQARRVPRADTPTAVAPMGAAVSPSPAVSLGRTAAMPRSMGAKKEEVTECAQCHATSSWTDVRFNHDRTGFPLTGAHSTVGCKECHITDFKQALPRSCVGCHRDVHAGDLGTQCEACHDTSTWRSRVDADAHRRTNFPLIGGHAALPCTECHAEGRERRYSRIAVSCVACHEADYSRTFATLIDHRARNFDVVQCRTCHGAYRFYPALYPDHDQCFVISKGPHAANTCSECHSSQRFSALPWNASAGACNTGMLRCTECHEHLCATMDDVHKGIAGYRCVDRKCYECHLDVGGSP